jgi:hypothetical protein
MWDRLCGTHRFPETEEKFDEYFAKAFKAKNTRVEKEIVVLNGAIGNGKKRRLAKSAE